MATDSIVPDTRRPAPADNPFPCNAARPSPASPHPPILALAA